MAVALTPAIIQAFADGARRGIPIATTCRLLDVPTRTFHQWCQDAEALQRGNGTSITSDQKTRAVALVASIQRAQAEREAELVERIANYTDKNGVHDWRASFALLTHGPSRENWYPHKPPSHHTLDVQHHPAHTQVRELETTELLALIEPDSSENV